MIESSNIPKILVLRILKEDLGKRELCARFVPHSLTPEQREYRVTYCQDIIGMADADNFFFNKLITGDETCFACDPETEQQSSKWVGETSPWPKQLKFERSRIKTMLIIFFFDSQGVLRKEFVPHGKTVNADFYKGVMDRLLKHIHRVRPAAFCSRDFFLLHDNAPAHKAASVCQFLTQKMLQPFITPVLSRFISARLFSVTQVENEVKRTPLCGCC